MRSWRLILVMLSLPCLALTSVQQPEFSKFQPVAITDMVNVFSGDPTYNLAVLEIAGAHGGGYALSLSYSPFDPEDDASWVGCGMTLCPGSVTRGKSGHPDDQKNVPVTYWNKTPPNWTVTAGGNLGPEIFSFDKLTVTPSVTLSYNNFRGFGYSKGFQAQLGIVSFGYHVSDGEGHFSASINPAALMDRPKKNEPKLAGKAAVKRTLGDLGSNLRAANWSKEGGALKKAIKSGAVGGYAGLLGSTNGIYSFANSPLPVDTQVYSGMSVSFDVNVMIPPVPLQAGLTFGVSGSYSRQVTEPQSVMQAYGYMYSGDAQDSSATELMDYTVEKLNAYDKNDVFTGIPFSSPDNFQVAGEGLSGGFRLFNRKAGYFRPVKKTSTTIMTVAGVEVEGGLDVGIGADISVGDHNLTVGKWNWGGDVERFAKPDEWGCGDEPVFFRFNNDLGGSVEFGDPTDPAADDPEAAGIVGSIRDRNPDLTYLPKSMSGGRHGRSSYITYHTNHEMAQMSGTPSRPYNAYTVDDSTKALIDRSEGIIADGIGEFVIYNEDGTCYQYGLPVYSRKEYSLQYDLKGVSGNDIKSNYLAYRPVDSTVDFSMKVGEERPTPYAATYLLTAITSPDYVDLTRNGVSRDDLGGYTKFNYVRGAGARLKDPASSSSDEWYRWRSSYAGLLYQKNEMSDPGDDACYVSGGEKEIYYLSCIETKSQIAWFDLENREDGLGAFDPETAAITRGESLPGTPGNRIQLKRLASIELFAKDDQGAVNRGTDRPLKTVLFDYDYSLSPGVWNRLSPTGKGSGKLTLRRLWFEYQGVRSARISPYEFDYLYPRENDYAPEVADQYPEIVNYARDSGISSPVDENPNYSPFDIDSWGGYQRNGAEKHRLMRPWVAQYHEDNFDPAAWQLKRIRLPSGGEIHIQYEQDDYLYVQDKHALAMVSLTDASDPFSSRFYVNASDLGIEPGDTGALDQLRDLIAKEYLYGPNGPKKIYFKFLYRLVPNPANPTPDLTDCNAEYVDGYAGVREVGRDGQGVFVVLGSPAGSHFPSKDTPHFVCRDLLKTQKAGKINLSGICDASTTGVPEGTDARALVESLVGFFATLSFPELCCQTMSPGVSYLRIPTPHRKAGGKLRAKRVLMYDPGIETGDAALYGSEYLYEVFDAALDTLVSSGVATNEPSAAREENALVEFLPRLRQKFVNRVIAGRDKEQTEGPLGDTVMEGPSVGYSRVVVKNIHKDKATNTGIVVNEFFTAKDFPATDEHTDLQSSARKWYLPIYTGIVNVVNNKTWAAQGFSFFHNSMHGQSKRVSTFMAGYGDVNHPDSTALSTLQETEYFAPNEPVPMLDRITQSPVMRHPGKEVEVVFETRYTEDIHRDAKIEFDLDVGIVPIPLIPYVTFMPYLNYTRTALYTHTGNRIVRTPAIVRRTRSYQEGVWHVTENLAFNPDTGKPVLARTTDGFHGLVLEQGQPAHHEGYYHTYTFPASREYAPMGQKAGFERSRFTIIGDITTPAGGVTRLDLTAAPCGGSVCSFLDTFAPGDLLSFGPGGIYHADVVEGSSLLLYPTSTFPHPGGHVTSLEVLRSGRTNQLNATAGSLTTYGPKPTITNVEATSDLDAKIQILLARVNGAIHSSLCVLADALVAAEDLGIGMKTGTDCRCVPLTQVHYSAFGDCHDFRARLVLHRESGDSCEFVTGLLDSLTDCPLTLGVDPSRQLYFTTADGDVLPIGTCGSFCGPEGDSILVEPVIAASAQSFRFDWPLTDDLKSVYFGPGHVITNPYEAGTRGKWRQEGNFVYRTSIIGANDESANERIYKAAGVFDDFTLFNWKDESKNDPERWLRLNTVTASSPHGGALEERNILGIFSTAKFGYQHMVPYLIAQNAQYGVVHFESFERTYGATEVEDGWVIPDLPSMLEVRRAHAGKQSLRFTTPAVGVSTDSIVTKPFPITAQLEKEGLSIKAWVSDTTYAAVPIFGRLLFTNGATEMLHFGEIAQTGEWRLFEARAGGWPSGPPGPEAVVEIVSAYSTNPPAHGSVALWLDDLRIQPLDTQMIAYVYDARNLRLVTSFDDQNFGLFYQYDDEGKLTFKIIETERGKKTVQETQYHTPLIARPVP